MYADAWMEEPLPAAAAQTHGRGMESSPSQLSPSIQGGPTLLTKTDRDDLPIEEWAPHLDLFDPEYSRRSLEVLAYARDHCTLLRTDADAGYYIAARYEDVRAMTAAPNVFSSIE